MYTANKLLEIAKRLTHLTQLLNQVQSQSVYVRICSIEIEQDIAFDMLKSI